MIVWELYHFHSGLVSSPSGSPVYPWGLHGVARLGAMLVVLALGGEHVHPGLHGSNVRLVYRQASRRGRAAVVSQPLPALPPLHAAGIPSPGEGHSVPST